MKNILLAAIIFISAFSIGYSQCTNTISSGIIGSNQTICYASFPSTIIQLVAPTNVIGTPTYVWQQSLIATGPFTTIAGATNTNLTSTIPFLQDTYIRRIITDPGTAAPCNTATSNVVHITVLPQLTAGVIAADQTICSTGDPAAFTQTTAATGGSGTYTYQWQSTTTSTTTAFSNIAGATNAAYDAPAGLTATTYYRRVDASGTCQTANTNAITITVSPAVLPSVSITVDKTIICSNDVVTFIATPINGGASPAYQWRKNGFPIVAYTNATFTTTNAQNGDSYTAILTSDLACIAPGTVTSNAIMITVTPIVVPSVTIETPSTTICSNIPVTFTATPYNGGTVPLYEWSINAVSQGPPSSYASFSTELLLSNSDVVRVTLTSNAGCASPSTASASMSITVNPGISAGTIGSDQTICYNSIPPQITEVIAPTNITGTPTYMWEASLSGLNGTYSTIPGSTNATFSSTVSITQDVYIRRVITDPGTPASCNIATSNRIHITVRPQLVAGVIGTDETVCSGFIPTAINQTTAPSGGTGTYTYQWQSNVSGSFANISGATSSSYIPQALTTTTKFQRVETSGTCGSVTSNVVTKTITTPEVVTASINDPGQVCSGSSSFTFTTTATTTGTGTLSYSWSLGTTNVGTNSSTYTYNPVAGDNGKIIMVRVTTSNGCNAGPATSNLVTLDIVGATTPTVSLTVNNNPQCAGLQTTFTSTSTGSGTSPFYQWYVIPQGSGVPVAVGTGANTFSSSSLQNGDQVYVELTSSLGCLIGTNPFVSNRISMVIKSIPTPTIIEGDQTVCSPNAFLYSANVGAGTTLHWWFNNNPITGATNANYVATQSGSYYIYEDNGTCGVASPAANLTVDPCGAFSTSITGPNPVTPGQQNVVYSVPDQTGFTYTWSITGGTIISGQNTHSVTVDWDAATNAFARTTSAVYSISVLEKNSTNQTKTTTTNINTITTAVTQSQAQSGINVFPNPTTGSFNIEMPESGITVSYKIVDLTGLAIASGTFTSTGSDQKIDADFGAGMYQVILTYNNNITCVRLSKVQ